LPPSNATSSEYDFQTGSLEEQKDSQTYTGNSVTDSPETLDTRDGVEPLTSTDFEIVQQPPPEYDYEIPSETAEVKTAQPQETFELSNFESEATENLEQSDNVSAQQTADAETMKETDRDTESPILKLDETNLLGIDESSEDSLLDLKTYDKKIVWAETQEAMKNLNLAFSPEIIDAIAERVVERLSDKVIEKIAWEIVPDRFDLIVRKHMENRER
jgi:hypothetical protein